MWNGKRSIRRAFAPAEGASALETRSEVGGERGGRALPVLERLDQDLRDVLHLDVVGALLLLHAVVEHHVAEGTRDRDPRRARLERLLGALDVHLLADVLLHPHARAAGSAAEATRAVARHLDDLDAADGTDHIARREVHVVVTTEVATVVVRDALVDGGARERQPTVGDELREQL